VVIERRKWSECAQRVYIQSVVHGNVCISKNNSRHNLYQRPQEFARREVPLKNQSVCRTYT